MSTLNESLAHELRPAPGGAALPMAAPLERPEARKAVNPPVAAPASPGLKRAEGRIPKGQGFIWWLIEKEKGRWMQLSSPLLFLVLFAACFWLSFRDAGQSLTMSLALVVQMYLHEQGHAFIFRRAGVRSQVWWLFPLGAVAAPINKEENAKSDLLPWWTIAWLLQAGVTVNVVLMGVGLWLQAVPIHWLAGFGEGLLYTGGMLAISNLLPVWQLDAGLLYHVIFSSLKEEDDGKVAWVTTGLMAAAVLAAFWSAGEWGFWQLLVAFITRLGWFVVLLLVAAGVWHRQAMDDPLHAASQQAMTRPQAVIHILWHIALLYLALRLVVGPLTPYII